MRRKEQFAAVRPRFTVTQCSNSTAPLLAGATSNRRIPAKLIVTTWPGSTDLLLIAVLPSDQMAFLRPGFATWHSDTGRIPYHPTASLEAGAAGTVLRIGATVLAVGEEMPACDEDRCMVGIVTADLLTGSAPQAVQFVDLLEQTRARIAEVDLVQTAGADGV